LRCNRTKESVTNDIQLPLTPRQLKDVHAKHSKQKDARIRITTAQVKYLKSVEGGGLLDRALSLVPSVATSVYNAWENKKANNKLVAERIGHNKAMEEIAVAKGTSGKTKLEGEGVFINKNPRAGRGVYINKNPKTGNGLYKELLKKKKSL